MDNKNVIASSLADNELARAFSELVAERWDNWDLSPFMAYLLDTCAPDTLPYLADQFDIDGLRGFEMAGDEAQQRDLIKRSIALHKFIGTPWAIREACRTIGFPVIALEEGITPEGSEPSPDDWARFRVLIEIDTKRYITYEETRKLRLFVEFYKNERSHLIELGFFQSWTDGPLFRSEAENREFLEFFTTTLNITPNPAIINVRGDSINVEIDINADWKVAPLIYWGDGTNDKIQITNNSGTAGKFIINISSNPNSTGKDREITAYIENKNGIAVGEIIIKQYCSWRNAYSHAYSRAYNSTSPVPPFVDIDKKTIWLENSAPHDEQINIKTNTDWNIN